MAYSVLEQLKEEALNCKLCYDVPGDHAGDTNVFKQLRCNHTFCKKCLQKLVKQPHREQPFPDSFYPVRGINEIFKRRITCPNCRVETLLDGNVDSLPSAFQVTGVIDWINKKQMKELKGKTVDRQCLDHEVPINFFCIDCCIYVCGDCLRLAHDQTHTTLHIKTDAGPIRQATQDMIKEIDPQLVHWSKALDHNNKLIENVKLDAINAKLLLKKHTDRIMRSLESVTNLLEASILAVRNQKLEQLRIENKVLKKQVTEIETKMKESRSSLDKADDYDVFNEHVKMGKLKKEFLAKRPPKVPPVIKETQGSLRFTPNLVSLKRLRNDIARIGTVHTRSDNESLVHVKNTHSEGISPTLVMCMESAVKKAYELRSVLKLEQREDRKTKGTFIMNRLKAELGDTWDCIIGDFNCFNWPMEDRKFATFHINDSDVVYIYKCLASSKSASKESIPDLKCEPRILHSSYDEKTDEIALACVKRNIDKEDMPFNIAQDFSFMMKTPWQCIIHNDAKIGLSRKQVERMKSDIPNMVTIRANGKDVWMLKMISFGKE